MILHLKEDLDTKIISALAVTHEGIFFHQKNQPVMVLSSRVKTVPAELEAYVAASFVMDSDIQLASTDYQPSKRTVTIGDTTIGGSAMHTAMIAGPCSVESRDQISSTAAFLKKLGIRNVRAGAFKPRTSPYSFQGLGEAGLKMLAEVRQTHGLNIVTEVKDSSHVDLVIDYADMVQIGTKAMYDQSILRKCGIAGKPVLLKRGFGTTLQEFVQAAEFILSQGNDQVMLCERGIRTFETKTRFTLDLTGVAYLKAHTNLPVIVDPSHAMGYRYGVPDLTRAATAMGVDGLLIETHPDPESAKSDAAQQLSFEEFEKMYQSIQPVAAAVGRTIT